MKVLKRKFDMSKEEVEENIRLLPYHREHIRIMREVNALRSDTSISSTVRLQMIKDKREELGALWRKYNEVQD